MIPAHEPTPTPPADEPTLVERARTDPAAFAVLYRRHYPAIAGYLFRRTGDAHAAEDLAGDVFLSAMSAIGRYRSRGVPLKLWLFRIATNAANKWARSRRRLRYVGVEGASNVADGAPETVVDAESAQRALLTLHPDHQAVLTLHHVESLSVEEVAAVLGWKVGTVKSRLFRAREALRCELVQGEKAHD